MKIKRHKKIYKINYITLGIAAFLCILLIILLKWDSIENFKKNSNSQMIAKQFEQQNLQEKESIRNVEESLPNIVCWGDSLTLGSGGNGTTYPSVLSKNIKLQVLNYGVGGESAQLIASRQGALKIYVNNIIIPSDTSAVEITMVNDDNSKLDLLLQGDGGINPCTINDIEGTVTYNSTSKKYCFTRSTKGQKCTISEKTQLITYAMKSKKDNDILIIFSGNNNSPTLKTLNELIKVQRQMIQYSGTDNYIIIGLTCKSSISEVEKINQALQKEYGDKFLDIRTYILENGLNDSGMTATGQDKTDISNGEIPSSLRVDNIHGNASFYTIIGNQVYKKILELKYLSDEQLGVLGIK